MTVPMPGLALSQQQTDFYTPQFEVRIGSRPVDREAIHDVLTVTFKDGLEVIDSFELTVNNWDGQQLKYSDGDLFAPGQLVELHLGYRDRGLTEMLVGEITGLQPSFPAAGVPALSVSGLSVLHRLRREQRTRVFEGKTDSEVARRIARDLDLEIETGDTDEQPLPYLMQHAEHDIVFLLKRARRIGYELTVRERDDGTPVLVYRPPSEGRETKLRLRWGGSLLSVTPNLSTARQVGSVTLRAWHRTSKRAIDVTVTRQELPGDEPFVEAFQDRREVITDRPVDSEAEARRLALEALRRIRQDYVTVSGSTVGVPSLRTGVLIELDGLGTRFNGTYFVTSTTHSLGEGGYVTSFEARREMAA